MNFYVIPLHEICTQQNVTYVAALARSRFSGAVPHRAAAAHLVCFPANCNTLENNTVPQSVTKWWWLGGVMVRTLDLYSRSQVQIPAMTLPGYF